jgi:DNA binding domain, excisionase family
MEDILYTVKEVASLLKCSPNYVYDLKKAGLLRFMKLGNLKCRKETLLKFLEDYDGKDLLDPFNVKDLEGGGQA